MKKGSGRPGTDPSTSGFIGFGAFATGSSSSSSSPSLRSPSSSSSSSVGTIPSSPSTAKTTTISPNVSSTTPGISSPPLSPNIISPATTTTSTANIRQTSSSSGTSTICSTGSLSSSSSSPYVVRTNTASSPSSVSAATPTVDNTVYTGQDKELQAITKRIMKKDETTKLKALTDLKNFIQDHKEDKLLLVKDLLGSWCSPSNGLFLALCMHNDRRIRYQGLVIMNELITIGLRKSFLPYLRTILPVWYNLLNDPANEVRKITETTFVLYFTSTYPLGNFMETLQTNITDLLYTYNQYLHSTHEELSDMRITSIEEATERMERIYTVTLDSLSSLTDLLFRRALGNDAVPLVHACQQRIKLSMEKTVVIEEGETSTVPSLPSTVPIQSIDENIIPTVLPSSSSSSSSSPSAAVPSLPSSSILALKEQLRSLLQTDIPWKGLLTHKSVAIHRAACRLLTNLCSLDPLSIIQTQRYHLPVSNAAPLRIVLPLADIPKALFSCAAKDTSYSVWALIPLFLRTFPGIWGIHSTDYENSNDIVYHDYYLRTLHEHSQFWYMYDSIVSSSSNSSSNLTSTDTVIVPPLVTSRTDFWNNLYNLGKHSCYGNGEYVYPNLVNVCILLPVRILFESTDKNAKDSSSTIPSGTETSSKPSSKVAFLQLFLNLLTGLQNTMNEEILTMNGQLQLYQAIIDLCVFGLSVLTRRSNNPNIMVPHTTNLVYTDYLSSITGILVSLLQLNVTVPVPWTTLTSLSINDNNTSNSSTLITSNQLSSVWYQDVQHTCTLSLDTIRQDNASLPKGIKTMLRTSFFHSIHQLQGIALRRKNDTTDVSSTSALDFLLSRLWSIVTQTLVTEICSTNTGTLSINNGYSLFLQLVQEFTVVDLSSFSSSVSNDSTFVTVPYDYHHCIDTVLDTLVTPCIPLLIELSSVKDSSVVTVDDTQQRSNTELIMTKLYDTFSFLSTILTKHSPYCTFKIYELLPFDTLVTYYQGIILQYSTTLTSVTSMTKSWVSFTNTTVVTKFIQKYTEVMITYGKENQVNLTHLGTFLLSSLFPQDILTDNVLVMFGNSNKDIVIPSDLTDTISRRMPSLLLLLRELSKYQSSSNDVKEEEIILTHIGKLPNAQTLLHLNIGTHTYSFLSLYKECLFYRMLVILSSNSFGTTTTTTENDVLSVEEEEAQNSKECIRLCNSFYGIVQENQEYVLHRIDSIITQAHTFLNDESDIENLSMEYGKVHKWLEILRLCTVQQSLRAMVSTLPLPSIETLWVMDSLLQSTGTTNVTPYGSKESIIVQCIIEYIRISEYHLTNFYETLQELLQQQVRNVRRTIDQSSSFSASSSSPVYTLPLPYIGKLLIRIDDFVHRYGPSNATIRTEYSTLYDKLHLWDLLNLSNYDIAKFWSILICSSSNNSNDSSSGILFSRAGEFSVPLQLLRTVTKSSLRSLLSNPVSSPMIPNDITYSTISPIGQLYCRLWLPACFIYSILSTYDEKDYRILYEKNISPQSLVITNPKLSTDHILVLQSILAEVLQYAFVTYKTFHNQCIETGHTDSSLLPGILHFYALWESTVPYISLPVKKNEIIQCLTYRYLYQGIFETAYPAGFTNDWEYFITLYAKEWSNETTIGRYGTLTQDQTFSYSSLETYSTSRTFDLSQIHENLKFIHTENVSIWKKYILEPLGLVSSSVYELTMLASYSHFDGGTVDYFVHHTLPRLQELQAAILNFSTASYFSNNDTSETLVRDLTILCRILLGWDHANVRSSGKVSMETYGYLYRLVTTLQEWMIHIVESRVLNWETMGLLRENDTEISSSSSGPTATATTITELYQILQYYERILMIVLRFEQILGKVPALYTPTLSLQYRNVGLHLLTFIYSIYGIEQNPSSLPSSFSSSSSSSSLGLTTVALHGKLVSSLGFSVVSSELHRLISVSSLLLRGLWYSDSILHLQIYQCNQINQQLNDQRNKIVKQLQERSQSYLQGTNVPTVKKEDVSEETTDDQTDIVELDDDEDMTAEEYAKVMSTQIKNVTMTKIILHPKTVPTTKEPYSPSLLIVLAMRILYFQLEAYPKNSSTDIDISSAYNETIMALIKIILIGYSRVKIEFRQDLATNDNNSSASNATVSSPEYTPLKDYAIVNKLVRYYDTVVRRYSSNEGINISLHEGKESVPLPSYILLALRGLIDEFILPVDDMDKGNMYSFLQEVCIDTLSSLVSDTVSLICNDTSTSSSTSSSSSSDAVSTEVIIPNSPPLINSNIAIISTVTVPSSSTPEPSTKESTSTSTGSSLFGFAASVIKSGVSLLGSVLGDDEDTDSENEEEKSKTIHPPSVTIPLETYTIVNYPVLYDWDGSNELLTIVKNTLYPIDSIIDNQVWDMFKDSLPPSHVSSSFSSSSSVSSSSNTVNENIISEESDYTEEELEAKMVRNSIVYSCTKGRLCLGSTVTSILEDPELIYSLEYHIQEICDETILSNDNLHHTLTTLPHLIDYLQTWLLSLRMIQHCQTDTQHTTLGEAMVTYLLQKSVVPNGSPVKGSSSSSSSSLSSPLSIRSNAPGANIHRSLEACFHLLLHMDEVYTNTVTAKGKTLNFLQIADMLHSFSPTMAIEQLINDKYYTYNSHLPLPCLTPRDQIHYYYRQLFIYAYTFVARVATVMQTRFRDIIVSYPKTMQGEIEGWIAKYLTPYLLYTQFADVKDNFVLDNTGSSTSSSSSSSSSVSFSSALGLPMVIRRYGNIPIKDPLWYDLQGNSSPTVDSLRLLYRFDIGYNLLNRLSKVSAILLANTVKKSSSSASSSSDNNLSVSINRKTLQVNVKYTVEEITVQLNITYPSSWPYRYVTVEWESCIGMSTSSQTRIEQQLIKLISSSDGRLTEAIQYLQTILQNEFAGVEPCPICYCTIALSNKQLPRVSCSTCKNKFHSDCLSRWFLSSNDRTCPLCRQIFRRW